MKKIIPLILLIPALCFSQKNLPRFENDTLFTSCGYKIYQGSTLNMSHGSDGNGTFRFFKIYSGDHHRLSGNSILIKKVKGYKISALGNGYVRIAGTITFKDGSKESIDLAVNFDRAIEGFPGLQPELIVPDEFKMKSGLAEKLKSLDDLYKENLITKDEYEAAKKKLLNQ
ncbi:MAG TPA: SHOCT domain-containing protein [Puia sp.]|jgi:hypothetical protein|nr:SHOCT domain-containing protein [Puia sp.]